MKSDEGMVNRESLPGFREGFYPAWPWFMRYKTR